MIEPESIYNDESLRTIVFEQGLYKFNPIKTTHDKKIIMNFFSKDISVNLFCVSCKSQNTFKIPKPVSFNGICNYDNSYVELNGYSKNDKINNDYDQFKGTKNFVFQCQINCSHTIIYTFLFENDYFVKIGQFPSNDMLLGEDLKKYRSLLSEEKYMELKKSNTLHFSGHNVGAFTYLRRIFEYIVNQKYEKHTKQLNNDNQLNDLSMKEKIDLIKPYLPQFLVDNQTFIYACVSEGIHNLSEEICEQQYECLYNSILLILREQLEEKEMNKLKKELTKGLNKYYQNNRNG